MIDDKIEIDGVAVRASPKAVLFAAQGRESWLPFSQISIEPSDWDWGSRVTVVIPSWLAEAKGLEEQGEPDEMIDYGDRQ